MTNMLLVSLAEEVGSLEKEATKRERERYGGSFQRL